MDPTPADTDVLLLRLLARAGFDHHLATAKEAELQDAIAKEAELQDTIAKEKAIRLKQSPPLPGYERIPFSATAHKLVVEFAESRKDGPPLSELEWKVASSGIKGERWFFHLALDRKAGEFSATSIAELRGKVEELKGLLSERNRERSDLRRQLAVATEQAAQAAQEATEKARRTDEDLEQPWVEAEGAGPVLIPSLSNAAQAALASAPRHIAAEAVRTLGSLAARDAPAWRRVKQAKDMGRPVLMARIGIHHRLLFRIDAGVVEAFDLIPRAELETVLKRLRSS